MKAVLLSISPAVAALFIGFLIGRHSASIPSSTTIPPLSQKPIETKSEPAPSISNAEPVPIVAPHSENSPQNSEKTDVIAGLKGALALSTSRHYYTALSNLIDSLDPAGISKAMTFAQGLTKP